MIEMKRIMAVWLVLLMLMGGLIGTVNLSTDAEKVGNGDAEIRYASTSQSKSYTPHDPIYIDSNDDFVIDQNGVVSGTGTQVDPYIIENWDINAGSANGIEIRNTNVYFIIRNCMIHDGWTGSWETSHEGIYFYNVTNGKINNITSYNNRYGTFLYFSPNNDITSCALHNNSYGTYLSYSSNNNITNCAVYNNYEGIYLYYSSNNNQILNCDVYNNDWIGVELWGYYGACNYNQITNCTVYNNYRGIDMWSSSNDNTITNCSVYNNSEGISLLGSSNNQITNCECYNNSYGVYIRGSSNNNVIANGLFYNNSYGVGLWEFSSSNIITKCSIYNNSEYGIYFEYSSDNNVTNCTIYLNRYGICLYQSSNNNNITNSAIYNNYDDGIQLYHHSNNNQINNCPVYNNSACGIYLYEWSNNNIITNCSVYNNSNGTYIVESSNNKLRDNIMNNNDYYNFGVWTFYTPEYYQDIDTSNTVDGKHIYYLVKQNNLTLDGLDMNIGYLGLIGCRNISVKNLNVSSNIQPLLFVDSSFITITNCVSHSNLWHGLSLYSSSNNNIVDCTFYNNSNYGVFISYSVNNTITNCIIYDNSQHGIYLSDFSNNNQIINCTCYDNLFGIYCAYSSNNITNCSVYNNNIGVYFIASSNTLTNCTIYNNSARGIDLQGYSSSNNQVTNCTLQGNHDCGIRLSESSHDNIITRCAFYNNYYGIYVVSSSNNNQIYHNNFFMGNTCGACDYGSNFWDNGYPSGGNYWEGYVLVDLCLGVDQNISGSDGIGDTPYGIPGRNNQDRYPLMNPVEGVGVQITTGPQHPDLVTFSADISFSNSTPKKGQNISITVRVRNIGAIDATSCKIKFYDGDPDAGGTKIGEAPVSVSAGSYIEVTIYWKPQAEGERQIYVVITDASPMESDTTNNKAYKSITVQGWGDVKKYALIIGIGWYEDWWLWPTPAAARGARIMKNLLVSSYCWDDENIILLIDSVATSQNIMGKLRELISIADGNDYLLVYYAAHGGGSEGKYWVYCYDKDMSIGDYWFELIFDSLYAGHCAIIFETCQSGGLVDTEFDGKTGTIAMSATNTTETLRPLLTSSGATAPFAYYFVCAHTQDRTIADINKDNNVSVEEAFYYAKSKMENRTIFKAHPQWKDNYLGELYLGTFTSALSAAVSCPVWLWAEDEQGRKTGNYSGEIYEEIPGTFYSELEGENPTIIVFNPTANITFRVWAYESGLFNLTIIKATEQNITFYVYENVSVMQNTNATVRVDVIAANYTMLIDDNADGVIDREIAPKISVKDPPVKVILSAPTEISKTSVKLTWTQNNDADFANYTIYRSTSESDLGDSIKVITDRTETSFVVIGLVPDTTYYFTVKVYNTDGYYSDSTQVSATTLSAEEVAKPSEIPWLYIIIPVIIIVVLATAVIGISRKRRKISPPLQPPSQQSS